MPDTQFSVSKSQDGSIHVTAGGLRMCDAAARQPTDTVPHGEITCITCKDMTHAINQESAS